MVYHHAPLGEKSSVCAELHKILECAKISCGRAIRGRNARSIILLGNKGERLTMLLNEIGSVAQGEGFLVSNVRSPDHNGLACLLYPEMVNTLHLLSSADAASQVATCGLRGLRGFASAFSIEPLESEIGIQPEPGYADSGDLQRDIPNIFEIIGQSAKIAGKGWVLLIEELQSFTQSDLSALIASMHRVSQCQLPVVLIGAGRPQVTRLVGAAKSYAERLFSFHEV